MLRLCKAYIILNMSIQVYKVSNTIKSNKEIRLLNSHIFLSLPSNILGVLTPLDLHHPNLSPLGPLDLSVNNLQMPVRIGKVCNNL